MLLQLRPDHFQEVVLVTFGIDDVGFIDRAARRGCGEWAAVPTTTPATNQIRLMPGIDYFI
jgi:hypothetical protein